MFARLASLRALVPVRPLLWRAPMRSVHGPAVRETRIVPQLPTFYSANPAHEAHMDRLEALLRKHTKQQAQRLLVERSAGDRPRWLSFDQYALIGGTTRLKPTQYRQLVAMLDRLHAIDPQLSNGEIAATLEGFLRKSRLEEQNVVRQELDHLGRACAVGRRKTSSAKVYLVRGSGEVLVNGRSLADYFVKMKDRDALMYPLRVLDAAGKYNIFAAVRGGGVTGQAEAIMHAVAKALVVFNPLLKTRLHRAGVLTRDYRHVERKKPGKRKARKMPAWVKR
ncbi:AaceriAER033Wp [[Ashbya] aceris (nom. inval.)]|nr:AaceriAER033Wp [[Ashbya] aceris (nom. inval.)]